MTPIQRLNWVLRHSSSVIAIHMVLHHGDLKRQHWKRKHEPGTKKGDQRVD
jgi:hypothetical protein